MFNQLSKDFLPTPGKLVLFKLRADLISQSEELPKVDQVIGYLESNNPPVLRQVNVRTQDLGRNTHGASKACRGEAIPLEHVEGWRELER